MVETPAESHFKWVQRQATKRSEKKHKNKIDSMCVLLVERKLPTSFRFPHLDAQTRTQSFRRNWGYCFIELPLAQLLGIQRWFWRENLFLSYRRWTGKKWLFHVNMRAVESNYKIVKVVGLRQGARPYDKERERVARKKEALLLLASSHQPFSHLKLRPYANKVVR